MLAQHSGLLSSQKLAVSNRAERRKRSSSKRDFVVPAVKNQFQQGKTRLQQFQDFVAQAAKDRADTSLPEVPAFPDACKFFGTKRGCAKGDRCPFRHSETVLSGGASASGSVVSPAAAPEDARAIDINPVGPTAIFIGRWRAIDINTGATVTSLPSTVPNCQGSTGNHFCCGIEGCGAAFDSRSKLQLHLRRSHNIIEIPKAVVPESVVPEPVPESASDHRLDDVEPADPDADLSATVTSLPHTA